VVGIHSQHGIEYLKESSCQFVARLAPVLYSPLWLSMLFCPAVVWALLLQHMNRQNMTRGGHASSHAYAALLPVTTGDLHAAESAAVPPEPAPLADHQVGAQGEQDILLEELFRQAKQASSSLKPRTA
jgi:hypothetical protein